MEQKISHIVLSCKIYVMIIFMEKIMQVFSNKINKEKFDFDSLMS
jgi:hypothetical protein